MVMSRSLKCATVPRGWLRNPSMKSCSSTKAVYPFISNLNCRGVTETNMSWSSWQVVSWHLNGIYRTYIVNGACNQQYSEKILDISDSCTLAQFLCADWKYFTCTIITQPPSMSSQSDSQKKFKTYHGNHDAASQPLADSTYRRIYHRQLPMASSGKEEVWVYYLQIGESCTVIVIDPVQQIRNLIVKCPTTSINKHLLNLPYHLTPSRF